MVLAPLSRFSCLCVQLPRMRCVTCLVVAVVVVAAEGAAAKEAPLIDTEGGLVSGILEETEKGRGFYSFYGIPFAQPPLGKLRFKVIFFSILIGLCKIKFDQKLLYFHMTLILYIKPCFQIWHLMKFSCNM